jgi:hypothetical protein
MSIEIDGFHSERVNTLLNRTDYWGVIDSESAQRIKDSFKYANKCGSFLWEVQETFSFGKKDRVPLIAVTHVRYSTSTYRPTESSDLDECTYYIARSNGGGYILMVRVEGSIIFESRGSRSTWFRSLSDAIFSARSERVSLTPQCVSQYMAQQPSLHLPSRCVCTDISRFSLVQKLSSIPFINPPQIRPLLWTLQDLTTFFIRNHSFHFQKEIVPTRELPISLKNRICDVRALNICFR